MLLQLKNIACTQNYVAFAVFMKNWDMKIMSVVFLSQLSKPSYER
jgi:hypothetical protein